MHRYKRSIGLCSSILCQAIRIILFVRLGLCDDDDLCNRRPLGISTEPLPADDRFVIDIEGVDKEYIPERSYTVRLYSRDNTSTFIAFTISANGDTKENERNPRRPIALLPGRILSSLDPTKNDTITKDVCPNSVFQSDITPKTSVEALWIAPPKENKCVTIYAYVAVKRDVWYSSDGPLSKRVCEDRRKAEDMQPKENDNCRVCEEARYELQFQGTWSYNTHPRMYPRSRELARFSDVVGASHSKNFYFYKTNSDASEGLKMLAEQGNTTQLEVEILLQLGTNVRTLIKATGPPKPNMTTISSFRVNKHQHLISLVSAIIPSPDWFLGVANLELCDAATGQWAKTVRLNLYPIDAGTDSGLNFESPNEETSPPQPVSPAVIVKDIRQEQIKPFAKLKVELIRTYSTPECVIEEATPYEGEDGNSRTDPEEPVPPVFSYTPRTISEPLPTDPTVSKSCPITTWEDWLPCEGDCVNGKVTGYQTRFRYYIVDGVEIGKNFENLAIEGCQTLTLQGTGHGKVASLNKNKITGFQANAWIFQESDEEKEIPEECLEYPTSEIRNCEEECEDPTEEPEIKAYAQRRMLSREPMKPGSG